MRDVTTIALRWPWKRPRCSGCWSGILPNFA